MLPAIAATRMAPQSALQDNSRGSVGSAFRQRARAALVVAEVALAVTLTIGAGLLLRSFMSLISVNPGFEPANMLTWQMNLPSRVRTQDDRDVFYRDFLARMKALPGVISVGGTSRLPLGSTGLTSAITVEGRGAAGRRVARGPVPPRARRLLSGDGDSGHQGPHVHRRPTARTLRRCAS